MRSVLEELEHLVRSGQFDEAERRLRKLGKIGRTEAAAVANIARRVNRPNLAAKILHSIVRQEDATNVPPTTKEKIEYAEALRRLGAVDEAWQLLAEADTGEFPEAKIYKVFCLFNQWNYEAALSILQDYVLMNGLAPYPRCVGKINLAAALIHLGKLEEASALLQGLREETRSSEFMLLYGNSLELSAQVLILQRDFDAALALLEEASAVLKGAGNVASLFVQKWKAIADSLNLNRTTQELRDLSMKARAAKHWETVRDCDLYMAQLDQDKSRFERLYFGTPYESFRQRIRRHAGPGFEVPAHYIWCSGAAGSLKSSLDLISGKLEGKKAAQLPTGQALHRFLVIISQDFYRPLPVMNIFGKLFPDEFMNADTSANRVHQIVKRCREWIAQFGLQMEIEQIDGDYRLVLGEGLGLIVPREPLPLDGKELEWLVLKSRAGSKPFDIHLASEILSSSASNTQRLLRWAQQRGWVERRGKGSRTSYRVLA